MSLLGSIVGGVAQGAVQTLFGGSNGSSGGGSSGPSMDPSALLLSPESLFHGMYLGELPAQGATSVAASSAGSNPVELVRMWSEVLR